jgi:hypothetical protein
MFLLFSHRLTAEKRDDANKSFGVEQFISLPRDLQELWGNIPTKNESISSYLSPLKSWLKENASKNDFILIQGDFGATYIMVNYCFSQGLQPVYATTKREVVERSLPDGTVKTERLFKHQIFRRYEKE